MLRLVSFVSLDIQFQKIITIFVISFNAIAKIARQKGQVVLLKKKKILKTVKAIEMTAHYFNTRNHVLLTAST